MKRNKSIFRIKVYSNSKSSDIRRNIEEKVVDRCTLRFGGMSCCSSQSSSNAQNLVCVWIWSTIRQNCRPGRSRYKRVNARGGVGIGNCMRSNAENRLLSRAEVMLTIDQPWRWLYHGSRDVGSEPRPRYLGCSQWQLIRRNNGIVRY